MERVRLVQGLGRHVLAQSRLTQEVSRISPLHTTRFQSNSATSEASQTQSAGSSSPEDSPEGRGHSRVVNRRDFRFIYPEFLPDPTPEWRNQTAERLVRADMMRRRAVVELPEFYVGTVVKVTVADHNSIDSKKTSKFVGIVIRRGGTGTRAWFTVRNHVDGLGVEFTYDMYCPSLLKVEVLKLEKRLDDEITFLRDADPSYSTFPQDMEAEILPDGVPTPISEEIVPLKPAPWHRPWDLYMDRFVGYECDPDSKPEVGKKKFFYHKKYLNHGWHYEVEKYDLLQHYIETIPMEEQDAIWREVGDRLEERDKDMRKVAAKRAFTKPSKRA